MGAVVVNCLSSEKETSCHFFLVNFRPQKGSSIKNGDSKSCTISSRPETSGRSSRHYENQCGKSDGTRWKTRRFESTSRRFRSWNGRIQRKHFWENMKMKIIIGVVISVIIIIIIIVAS